MNGDYLRRDGNRNVFELDCPGCGATGEVGVLAASGNAFKHECGTFLIQQQRPGMFAPPFLAVVYSPPEVAKST